MKHRAGQQARPVRTGPIAAVVAAVGCVAGGYWVVDDASASNAAMVTAQAADHDCLRDFGSQTEAQAYFDGHGYSADYDPEGLDDVNGVGDGKPCESLPAGSGTSTPSTTVVPEETSPADQSAIDAGDMNHK